MCRPRCALHLALVFPPQPCLSEHPCILEGGPGGAPGKADSLTGCAPFPSRVLLENAAPPALLAPRGLLVKLVALVRLVCPVLR